MLLVCVRSGLVFMHIPNYAASYLFMFFSGEHIQAIARAVDSMGAANEPEWAYEKCNEI